MEEISQGHEEHLQGQKEYGRRSALVKIGKALFAFVPAIIYLQQLPHASAYTPCVDEPTSTSCGDWYCVGLGCYPNGTKWGYYARLCTTYGVKSNEECSSQVEWDPSNTICYP